MDAIPYYTLLPEEDFYCLLGCDELSSKEQIVAGIIPLSTVISINTIYYHVILLQGFILIRSPFPLQDEIDGEENARLGGKKSKPLGNKKWYEIYTPVLLLYHYHTLHYYLYY